MGYSDLPAPDVIYKGGFWWSIRNRCLFVARVLCTLGVIEKINVQVHNYSSHIAQGVARNGEGKYWEGAKRRLSVLSLLDCLLWWHNALQNEKMHESAADWS